MYYKIITDIDGEKERINSINKIGVTEKEITKFILSELKIIFFAPVILGCGLGLYYLSVMFDNSELKSFIMIKTLIVVGVYLVLQIIFYFISKRKYLNEAFSL